MGTLVEEILSRRVGRPVHAGDTVIAEVDAWMAHDVTGPLAIDALSQPGDADLERRADHLQLRPRVPSNSVAASELHRPHP